jgi:hypothetical protein
MAWGTKGHQNLGASGPAGLAPICNLNLKSKSNRRHGGTSVSNVTGFGAGKNRLGMLFSCPNCLTRHEIYTSVQKETELFK